MSVFVRVLLLALCLPLYGVVRAQPAPDAENTLYLDLTYGRVVIQMRPDLAPLHVARIKHLVRGGFYDGLAFHRVISGFIAQAGDQLEDGGSGTGRTLKAEFSKTPHLRGVVSMARASARNSADSGWFIVLNNRRDEFDGKYTVWGEVTSGMEFVDMIVKGDLNQDGKVREPDHIVRMQVAADANKSERSPPADLLKSVGAGEAAREFAATEVRCGALIRGVTAQAALAQLWAHGFVVGRMKAENRVNVAGAEGGFEDALTAACTQNPGNMILVVTGRDLAKNVMQLPPATPAFTLDTYTCKDYVSARKASDKTAASFADLWVFAAVQGFKNIGQSKVDIAFKDRAKISTALEAVCTKNPKALFLDYAAALASKVTIK